MGYSYGNSDAPEMCFNAAKGWQVSNFFCVRVNLFDWIKLTEKDSNILVGMVQRAPRDNHHLLVWTIIWNREL